MLPPNGYFALCGDGDLSQMREGRDERRGKG